MFLRKAELAIINREFWPDDQVNGEALLRFAERSAREIPTRVITQSHVNLASRLAEYNRGKGIQIRYCWALSNSSTNLFFRALDAVLFVLWCAIQLLISRPQTVYVATSPPVVVPFIVFLYAKLFRAKYVYHLQDIHPEATNIVVRIHPCFFKLLRAMDAVTLRHASRIITLSEEMTTTLRERSGTSVKIAIIDNPAVFDLEGASADPEREREGEVIFCGNAGRLQRIPLLLKAIREYYRQGGRLRFTFAGGGVYKKELSSLAAELETVTYHGVVPAAEATRLVSRHRWALLPIDDEVTRYAFPSKSSCYLVAGCRILAICSSTTSVARWVEERNCGRVVAPDVTSVVAAFKMVETELATQASPPPSAFLRAAYSVETHAAHLYSMVIQHTHYQPSAIGQKVS